MQVLSLVLYSLYLQNSRIFLRSIQLSRVLIMRLESFGTRPTSTCTSFSERFVQCFCRSGTFMFAAMHVSLECYISSAGFFTVNASSDSNMYFWFFPAQV